MTRHFHGLGITCGVLALGAGLGGPAGASVVTGQDVSGQTPAATSPTIAGWTSDRVGDGSVKRFVVPSLDCRQAQEQAVGIGVGRQTDPVKPDIIAEVVMFCDDRDPRYLIEVFVAGSGSQSVVSAGDELRFEISYDAGMATVAAADLSSPGAGLTMSGPAEPAALHFGAFPFAVDGLTQAVPDFGTVRLTKARSAGAALSKARATKVRRVENGETKITAGPISTAGSFHLRFVNH